MPNLAKEMRASERMHRRLLHEAGKTQWPGALRDAQTWTSDARRRIQDELKKIRAEYAERFGAWFPKGELVSDQPPRRDHVHNLIAAFTLVGGLFAAFLEGLLAALLSITFMNLAWYWAATVGIGVTIFFAGLVMACIAALVLARYPDRTRATSRPLIIILTVTMPLALLLMTIFFLTRGVDSAFLEAAFGWDTAFLAIDLPVIAGVLLTLRGLFNWSGLYEDSYQTLLAAGARVEDLRSFCDRELGEAVKFPLSGIVVPPAPPPEHPSPPTAGDANGSGTGLSRTS